MNQGKARGDYSTAYKLSRAGLDRKAERRQRRSIEQKEFRQTKLDKRRNLCDLSPLNEGDVTTNKSYADKTPVRGKASDKSTKALDRLEQLKKWKQERERKRKTDDNINKPAFRVSKALDRKSETKLFEASKMKKHPVKPQPVPVSKPVVVKLTHPTISKQMSQKSVKTKAPPATSTRQSTATRRGKENVDNKQTRVQKEKEVPTRSSTRVLRSSTRQASVGSSTTTTTTKRSNNKAAAKPKVPEEEPAALMSSFITQRSDISQLPDSFAPSDFAFDASSFVFRPLSPTSAAGFLSASQNTSCSSFVESNPKRSSTPKRRKEEQVVKIDTTVVEEPMDQDKTSSEEQTTLVENNDTVVNSPVLESKKVRRSRRQSSLSTTNSAKNSDDAPISVAKPTVMPSSTPRRSLRVSVLSANTEEKDSSKTAVSSPDVRRSGRRRSVAASNSESDVKSNVDVEMNSPAKRRSTRRSITSTGLSADIKVLAIVESTTRETRRSRRSVAPVIEAEPIPETEESSQESDEVFEDETDSHNMSNKENDAPADTILPQESPSQRKTPKRSRNKSFGGFRLPSADSVVLSGKRSRRKTLMPKSPEEWVEVLTNSPMVEMSRRKQKKGSSASTPVPALNFDDVDLNDYNTEKENAGDVQTDGLDTQTAPVVNLNAELEKVGDSTDGASETITVDSEVKAEENKGQTGENDVVMVEATTEVENKENIETNKTDAGSVEHDIPYFRQLLVTETDRLSVMCDHWTKINEKTQLSDDIHGQIRATVGKAQLLIAQRFKQFRGLVDNCEFKTGEKETTCTDLDGFWEMVYFQVEDCDNKFAELKKLQANNWIDDTIKPVVKKIKKKVKPAVTKPVVKSKFAAFRAQMKKQNIESVNSPAVVENVEEKVFEIPGFFTVSSPVRSPKPHCAAGTPNKATPSSSTKKHKSAEKPVLKDTLAVGTPPRRSYLPAVPSPLLQDTTPLPRPSRGCTKKTPIPKRIIDEVEGSEFTIQDSDSKKVKRTARRSLRSRQSVNFADVVPDSPKPDVADDDFARLLEPSINMETNEDCCDVSNESFSKYLEPSTSILNASSDKGRGSRRRSALKSCKSTERRRSRQRSVHFGSPQSPTVSNLTIPHTPYNKDSLVEQKRVTRSTPSKSYDIFDFDEDNNDENVPPPSYGSSRVSLLGTPPDIRRKVVPTIEVPTANLLNFTP